ncbi:MAG: hypothetical protein HY317_03215 [Acidobacteria bacterium]|nr:hypothetical protein [Acidobacteriota bacterium]
MKLDQIAREALRDELPGLLGELVTAEAIVRIRLSEAPPPAPPAATGRVIGPEQMAALAGTSKRAILAKTRGLKFRCDLSRKRPRAVEVDFVRWLAERRG